MALHDRILHALQQRLRTVVVLSSTITALLLSSVPSGAFALTNPTWTLRSIDNMHASRDFVCWQQSPSFMAAVAQAEKSANTNYAAIATPYDAPANYHQCSMPKDPIAYETAWVQALRAAGLQIWFRQTWFNWEGSYGAPKLTSTTTPAIKPGTATNVLNGTDTTSYMAKTYHFILDHRGLFANGDIFTPEAEPQNGGIRQSYGGCNISCQFEDWPSLNRWLRDSMTVHTAAFRQLGLSVTVGYWGLPCSNNKWNGANNIEASTITQMIFYVTDCYYKDVPTLVSHLELIHNTYNAPVIVGEWGEIWDTDPVTVQREVGSAMSAVSTLPYIRGFNYWQGIGGSGGEGLIDKTMLTLNQTGLVVKSKF